MMHELAARLIARSGLRPFLGAAFRWTGVMCLNYHRIGDGSRGVFDRGVWSASAEDFDRHVAFLKSHFDVVTPDDLPDVCVRPRDRFVLITFDDGYRDNYAAAFPILKRHGVAATFFVTTGFLDTRRLAWWDEIAWMVRTSARPGIDADTWLPGPVVFDEPDREHAVETLLRLYKSLPSDTTEAYLEFLAEATGAGRCGSGPASEMWMTWDMLREMRAAGMVIGGHTVSHPVLANLAPERQCEEIAGCATRLIEEIGEPLRYFSYPVGQQTSFTGETRACVRQAGVRYAFSYYGGFRQFHDWDDMDVRRMAIERFMSQDWFRAIVTLPGVFGRAR